MTSLTVLESTLEYFPCVVCLKNVFRRHQNAQELNTNLLQLFIKVLERMSLAPLIFPKEVRVCNDCAVIVESVTKLFHQIQCLQLQLDWNLDKVRRVMVLADMEPVRVHEFKEKYKSEGIKTKDLNQLRFAIKNKLKRHQATTVPKVVLHDCLKTTSYNQGVTNNASNNLETIPESLLSIVKTEDNDHIFSHVTTCKLEYPELIFGFGWMISFVTVASLGALSSEVVSVNASEIKAEWDNHETEATAAEDDDHCSMIFYEALEETTEDAENDLAEPSTAIQLQSIPVVQLEKLNVTLPVPKLSELCQTYVVNCKLDIFEKNDSIDNASEPQKQDLNQVFEPERRLLRRRYKCTHCLMSFSTLSRLEFHMKTCNAESDKENGSESHSVNLENEEENILNEGALPKTVISENASLLKSSSVSPDIESDTSHNNVIRGSEVKVAFECLLCKNSFLVEGVGNKKLEKIHNAHMHSNGQVILDQSAVNLLQLAAADVQLDSRKFSMQICSFSECKNLVFSDTVSFEFYKSLHGVFKCVVCEFECTFAVQLAIHEIEHSPTTNERMSCPRCPFETDTVHNYYNHFLESHLNLKTQQAKCGVCAKTFPGLTVPLTHFVNEHDVSRLEKASRVFRCSKVGCDAYFLKLLQLRFHCTKMHPKSRAAKPKPNQCPLLFLCGKCSKRFHTRIQLAAHSVIAHRKVTDIGTKVIPPSGMTIDEVVSKTKPTYSCSVKICQQKFMTQLELETHSKLHGTFPCQFCPKVFQFGPNLSLHERTHGSTKWKCPRCDYKTGTRNRYVHHHLETHLMLVPDQIRCPTCHYRFYGLANNSVKKSLLYHFTMFHDPASLPSGQSFFNCDICSANFITGLQLDNHKYQMHTPEVKQNRTIKDNQKLSCPICKKKFDLKRKLEYHKKTVHTKTKDGFIHKYKCRPCLTSFYASRLKTYRHLRVCHKNYKHSNGKKGLARNSIRLLNLTAADVKLTDNFTQHICSAKGCKRKIFASDSSSQFHQSLHGNFTCSTCDQKRNFALRLFKHELGHAATSGKGQSGVKCPRCELTPVDPVRHFLENHLKISSAEKSRCDICQSSFTEPEVPFHHYINEHDLSRLDDMNSAFKCEQDENNCHAYFLTNDQLQVHIQRVHRGVKGRLIVARSYSCDQCSEQYGNKLCLRLHHAKTHTRLKSLGDKQITSDGITIDELISKKNAKYICSVGGCSARFQNNEDLANHSQLHGKFSCVECHEEMSFAPDLAIHEASHRVKPKRPDKLPMYTCCRCNDFSCFQKDRYVQHHLEIHLGLRPDALRCPVCKECLHGNNMKDLQKSALYHYCSTHDVASLTAGEIVAKCNLCPANFLTETQLSNHIDKIHGRLNNISKICADCGKAFQTHIGLILHRKRIHFVNKSNFQFICDVENCGKKFEYKIGLEWHAHGVHKQEYGTYKWPKCSQLLKPKSFKQHWINRGTTNPATAPFLCEKCGKLVKTKADLLIHQLSTGHGCQFVCRFCFREFGRKTLLKQHMKVHPNRLLVANCLHCLQKNPVENITEDIGCRTNSTPIQQT